MFIQMELYKRTGSILHQTNPVFTRHHIQLPQDAFDEVLHVVEVLLAHATRGVHHEHHV